MEMLEGCLELSHQRYSWKVGGFGSRGQWWWCWGSAERGSAKDNGIAALMGRPEVYVGK